MHFVIVGAGNVGAHLALSLSQEEHNVVIIDPDPQALELVAQVADVATRLASGTNWVSFVDLIEEHPTILIAVASTDEINLVACAIAKHLGFDKTVARLRDPSFMQHGRINCQELFSIDHVISSEMIVAGELFKQLTLGSLSKVENFANGAVQMRTLKIDKDTPEVNKKLADLSLGDNLLIGLIFRPQATLPDQPENQLIFPRGDDLLLPGDEVSLIGTTEVILKLDGLFGLKSSHIHSVALSGGSNVTIHLANMLIEHGIRVKVIDPDEHVCRRLSVQIPHGCILRGNSADPSFLKAEGIAEADAFAACSKNEQHNILAAAIAKELCCEHSLALISETSYVPILHKLQISFAASEKVEITNRILALAQSERIIALSSLYNGNAKILEMKIRKEAEAAGICIADLSQKLPPRCLIAFIQRKEKVYIAKGNFTLLPEDTLIVISDPKGVPELLKLF